MRKTLLTAVILCMAAPALAEIDVAFPVAQLRMLDKTTARNVTFEAKVGSTLKFGELFIRTQACRKSSPLEKPESAAFLQIWENNGKNGSAPAPEWIYSGWMFASSPALSAMDHAVYDVWVIDCLTDSAAEATEEAGVKLEGEGEVKAAEESALPDIEIEALPAQ